MQKRIVGLLWAIVGLFTYYPLWFFIMFKILKLISATEVLWFAFWIYVPLGFFLGIIRAIHEQMEED